jgi:hypothetical protein
MPKLPRHNTGYYILSKLQFLKKLTKKNEEEVPYEDLEYVDTDFEKEDE